MSEWIRDNIAVAVTLLAMLGSGVVMAFDEAMEYMNMKEAVREQRQFNEDFRTSMSEFSASQSRLDERSEMIIRMLEQIKVNSGERQ